MIAFMRVFVMLAATQALIGSLEEWAKAIRQNDFQAARSRAEHLIMTGEPLAIHPEFQRCFARHRRDSSPQEALALMCQFLVCATDGRAQVLKQGTKDPKIG
jgi:hypothetical protein